MVRNEVRIDPTQTVRVRSWGFQIPTISDLRVSSLGSDPIFVTVHPSKQRKGIRTPRQTGFLLNGLDLLPEVQTPRYQTCCQSVVQSIFRQVSHIESGFHTHPGNLDTEAAIVFHRCHRQTMYISKILTSWRKGPQVGVLHTVLFRKLPRPIVSKRVAARKLDPGAEMAQECTGVWSPRTLT